MNHKCAFSHQYITMDARRAALHASYFADAGCFNKAQHACIRPVSRQIAHLATVHQIMRHAREQVGIEQQLEISSLPHDQPGLPYASRPRRCRQQCHEASAVLPTLEINQSWEIFLALVVPKRLLVGSRSHNFSHDWCMPKFFFARAV